MPWTPNSSFSFGSSAALEPYYSTIEQALNSRSVKAGDFETDLDYKAPRYVVRMCMAIQSAALERGARLDLPRVMKAETLASGHSDYHRKFALYCMEMEREQLRQTA